MSWDMVELGEICTLVNGDAYKDSDWSASGTPIIRIQNLNDPMKPFNYWAGSLDKKVEINNGDLLLAWSGTPGTSFGAHIWERGKAVLNQHIFKVVIKTNVNPLWLKIAINQELDAMIGKAHGAVGLRHITKKETEKLKVTVPPLDEQHRIIVEVERQLAIIEKAKRTAIEQLAAARALNAAYLRDVFDNIEGEQTKLGDICTFEGGSQPPKTMFKYSPQEDYIRLIQIQDYRRDDMAVYIPTRLARRFCKKDDVMIGRYGPPVFQILRGLDGAYNVALMKAYPKDNDKLDNGFLFYLLQEERVQRAVIKQSQRSAGQTGVDKDFLEKLGISLPDIDAQRRITTEIENNEFVVSKTIATVQAQLDIIYAMPAAILRQAFSGRCEERNNA
jgi:type I restriction enzyme S subunit